MRESLNGARLVRAPKCFHLRASRQRRTLGRRKDGGGSGLQLLRQQPQHEQYEPTLPEVRVPQLASHILGQMARRVPRDWEQVYGHPVCYLETFVDPTRWRGTCYRAANWTVLGLTTGRGKASNSHRPNRPLKQVLGYPLDPRFRQMLGAV